MATIPTARARLHTEAPNFGVYPVNPDTEFLPGDILTLNGDGQLTKLEAGGAGAVDLLLAVEKYPDRYYEPLGEQTPTVQAGHLGGGVLIELNVEGVFEEAHIGSAFGLTVSGGIAKVDLAAGTDGVYVIERLADEVYGGVMGDTDVRVVGYFLDAPSVGE